MGGRIIVESVAGCSWNRWPDGCGIRKQRATEVFSPINIRAFWDNRLFQHNWPEAVTPAQISAERYAAG
jgi:hypothetical protein